MYIFKRVNIIITYLFFQQYDNYYALSLDVEDLFALDGDLFALGGDLFALDGDLLALGGDLLALGGDLLALGGDDLFLFK